MSDENARNVLEVYRHFGLEAGQALTSNSLLAAATNHRWDTRELQSGLELAISRGWIEKTPTGWLQLTKSGFERMPGSARKAIAEYDRLLQELG